MQAWEEKYYEREEGRMDLLKEQISKKLCKGYSVERIADELEESVETVRELIAEMEAEENYQEK